MSGFIANLANVQGSVDFLAFQTHQPHLSGIKYIIAESTKYELHGFKMSDFANPGNFGFWMILVDDVKISKICLSS